MRLPALAPVALLALAFVVPAARAAETASPAPAAPPAYRKFTLSEQFFGEGAAFADLDRDGHVDAVSGPYWYAGPTFEKRREIYAPAPFDPLRYSDNFFTFTHDFNADGWPDVLVLGFPGLEATWFENPGAAASGPWRRHVAFMPVDNESPTFAPLLTGAPPVVVCSSGGRLGYLTADPKDPTRMWTFHPISPPGHWQRFTHGLGVGDIDGDGRADLLDRDGWWQQPAALAGDPVWLKHPFAFAAPGTQGGAQMIVHDFNGDGLADVATAHNAHGYGLSWFEQVRAPDGAITFREHLLTSRDAAEKINGVQFSQPHALALADIDGDGLPDLVTGKRWWAHGPKGDVDPAGTPVLVAFLLRRGADHTATFEPRLLDESSGIGTQVVAQDINADGRADIIVGNKRGTFVFVSTPR